MTSTQIAETVVVIGASSSIGVEISRRFRLASARVISTYAGHAPVLEEEKKDAFHLDLRDNRSIDNFAEGLREVAPQVDVAIFLAGMLPGKSLEKYEHPEIDEVMSVNFSGQAKVLSRILPLLTRRSCVLMFSSISAQRGSFDPIYAASKGALLSFVKSMASRLPAGARINALAPGLIQDSTMFHDMAEERQTFHRQQIPSGQLLKNKDLANVVFDLCQDHWAHLNGACIDLNGGQYVR